MDNNPSYKLGLYSPKVLDNIYVNVVNKQNATFSKQVFVFFFLILQQILISVENTPVPSKKKERSKPKHNRHKTKTGKEHDMVT